MKPPRNLTVKRAIDAWDPYGLLACGAPSDEFDLETMLVCARISPSSSVDEIARVLSMVFSNIFTPRDFSVEACRATAEEIYKGLHEGMV